MDAADGESEGGLYIVNVNDSFTSPTGFSQTLGLNSAVLVTTAHTDLECMLG